MIYPPAVCIHGLAHASVALAQARPVTLISARGAALYTGCSWWREIVMQARRDFANAAFADILDCADAPGRAMAALRIGQCLLVLEPCPAWDAVAGAAASLGATLLSHRPPSMDLAVPGAARQLPAWLAERGDRSGEVS